MSFDMQVGQMAENVEQSTRSARGRRPAKSSQGQTGPKLDLVWGKLSKNEKHVLKIMLPEPGEHRKPMTIAEIAADTGWTKRMSKKKANSWVRNQMRRLHRAGFVEHAEKIKDGNYVLTDYGKRQAKSHVETKPEPRLPSDLPQVQNTAATINPISF